MDSMTMTARVGERQDQTLVGGQVRLNGARVGSTKDDGVGVVEKVVSKGRATNQPDHPANGPRGPRRTVSVTGHHNQPLTRPPLPSSSTHHHRRQPGRPPYPSIHHHCSSRTSPHLPHTACSPACMNASTHPRTHARTRTPPYLVVVVVSPILACRSGSYRPSRYHLFSFFSLVPSSSSLLAINF